MRFRGPAVCSGTPALWRFPRRRIACGVFVFGLQNPLPKSPIRSFSVRGVCRRAVFRVSICRRRILCLPRGGLLGPRFRGPVVSLGNRVLWRSPRRRMSGGVSFSLPGRRRRCRGSTFSCCFRRRSRCRGRRFSVGRGICTWRGCSRYPEAVAGLFVGGILRVAEFL